MVAMSDSAAPLQTFRIVSSLTGAELYKTEAVSLRDTVEMAVRSGANLSGANLSGADLSEATLSGANLSRADLLWANLSWADLSWANLSWANLSGANLSWANLLGANLSRANLSGANLSEANLSGADLSGANLLGANLSRANLSGANLSEANLSGASGINTLRCTYLEMLRDQTGPIRAYKLVMASGEGPYNGGITYTVGQSYEVLDANTDAYEPCGAGINLATLDWCLRDYRPGYRVFVAEFCAADIAAIPVGSDGKFRVLRCRIVGEKTRAELGLDKEDADRAAWLAVHQEVK
jgi:uncharacterized protein YjbI with pentapeptide repeats